MSEEGAEYKTGRDLQPERIDLESIRRRCTLAEARESGMGIDPSELLALITELEQAREDLDLARRLRVADVAMILAMGTDLARVRGEFETATNRANDLAAAQARADLATTEYRNIEQAWDTYVEETEGYLEDERDRRRFAAYRLKAAFGPLKAQLAAAQERAEKAGAERDRLIDGLNGPMVYAAVVECNALLDAAGMGALGKPNTLREMVKEIITERDAARREVEELTGVINDAIALDTGAAIEGPQSHHQLLGIMAGNRAYMTAITIGIQRLRGVLEEMARHPLALEGTGNAAIWRCRFCGGWHQRKERVIHWDACAFTRAQELIANTPDCRATLPAPATPNSKETSND